jgi:scaffold protein (connect acetoacetyl-CoA thiolase and HMG-CoA synthase)
MGERKFTSTEFRKFLGDHKLAGSRCRSCGARYLPPRPLCPACYSDDMEWVEMAGQGKLIAFTIVYIAPTAMLEAGYGRENPYCTGIVQLDEGPSISAQILGVDVKNPAGIKIGMPLTIDFVERGEGEAQRTFLAFKAG